MTVRVETIEMHTGGEPVRIVVAGYPVLEGPTILAKRRFAREHHDALRRLLMHEPRGHYDMYGVLPVEPDHPDADLAVLFIHNEGYSTMCGHATLAIGRWAVDTGLVPATEPVTRFVLQVPSGTVDVEVDVTNGTTGSARFRSVPAFVTTLDARVDVPGYGDVLVDVAFGGAFYAIADAGRVGLDVRTSPTRDLVDAAWAVTGAVRQQIAIDHPDDPDLAFLYGTILTDGADQWSDAPTANVCVFADREVDRSPTGSGVTARIAIQRARGIIEMGVSRRFESVTGSVFTGRAIAETTFGGRAAWIVEVGGRSHYTGRAEFTLEDADPLPSFLLR